jgi:hypothetical protein
LYQAEEYLEEWYLQMVEEGEGEALPYLRELLL